MNLFLSEMFHDAVPEKYLYMFLNDVALQGEQHTISFDDIDKIC